MEEYYFKNYVSFPRWASFYEQISEVVNLSPKNILEIGLGSKIAYAALKELGFKIIGFDNDIEVKPDILGDVRNLTNIFKENQFDCVCAFQVLEHLPFNEFENIVRNISKISSKYAVFSFPYAGYTIGFEFRISRIGERVMNLTFRIPRFWHRHIYDGMHYWEIGSRGYHLSKIENILSKYFKIINKKFIKPNKAIVIFVLEKG